jgi:hypothetical protein
MRGYAETKDPSIVLIAQLLEDVLPALPKGRKLDFDV